MCVCLLTINSFDRLCQQLVFFICQPLNQQQTARCDKCDVGCGGRAGNQKKKRKKKEREIKKYIPAACCLSKGWLVVSLLGHLAQKNIDFISRFRNLQDTANSFNFSSLKITPIVDFKTQCVLIHAYFLRKACLC